MAIQELTEEQIRDWSVEQKDRWWLENVYRGDMPQLTLRSAITGFLLGGILSATNLYIGAKTGWSLGVGITSVILAFAIFKILQGFGVKEFTILENNAMQSIATSAGYMTAPLTSSMLAYMVLNKTIVPWWQLVLWNVSISILGVLFAFPMKRRFINDEQHPFPEGGAAAYVMDSLHSSDANAGLAKAKVLMLAAGFAGFIKFLQAASIQLWIQATLWFPRGLTKEKYLELKKAAADKVWVLKEDLFSIFKISPKWCGIEMEQLTVAPAIDLLMLGAGGLMGIRAATWLLIGASVNCLLLAPALIQSGDIKPIDPNAEHLAYGYKAISQWSVWPGVTAMVVVSLVALFAKPEIFKRAFSRRAKSEQSSDAMAQIEFPMWISVVGIPVMALVTALLGKWFFNVEVWVSLVGLPLTYALSLVAATSTALTSTTPVGATSKITQLFYGLVRPGQINDNIATASITAEVVSNSSNLLMDIKPGYMLGAKPRQQAIGHIIGIFSGAIASTLLFYPIFVKGLNVDPNDPSTIGRLLESKEFRMPSAVTWKSIAEVLSQGISALPQSALTAAIIAAVVALVLEVVRIISKNKLPLSPIAFGLAFVLDFGSCFSMWLGAFVFWCLGVGRARAGKAISNVWTENHEPICAGIVAGASMVGIFEIVVKVFFV